VSTADYIVDIALILVIFRRARPRELTVRSALLPLVLLVAAGVVYLRPSTPAGNDLALIAGLTAAGIALGLISGLSDVVWRGAGQRLLARAGLLSIVAWLAGMGFRFAFAYYATHSGGPAVASFSVRYHITGAETWTTALVLMAFGQVLARVGALQVRRVRADRGGAAQTAAPGAAGYAGRRAQ